MERTTPGLGHLERTMNEPRDLKLHQVVIRQIREYGSNVRHFRLEITDPNGIDFRPGQWLDVYVPNIPQAGGFTITSHPSEAMPRYLEPPAAANLEAGKYYTVMPPFKYLEIAVQESPLNPPAAWLWQDPRDIRNKIVEVRVGGSFIYPPFPLRYRASKPVDKIIFLAGGVGVNPLMSMLSAIATESCSSSSSSSPTTDPLGEDSWDNIQRDEIEDKQPRSRKSGRQVHFLYSVKDPGWGGPILFLDRIARLYGHDGENDAKVSGELKLFITPPRTPPKDRDRRLSRLLAEQAAGRAARNSSSLSSYFWESETLGRNRASNKNKRKRISKEAGEKTSLALRPAAAAAAAAAAAVAQNSWSSSSSLVATSCGYPVYRRRISREDVDSALGEDKNTSVMYICGPPPMTDYFVQLLTSSEASGGFGMAKDRVLFEKWW